MRLADFSKGLSAFNKTTPLTAKLSGAALLFILGWLFLDLLYVAYAGYLFNHLSYAEHLRIAKSICHVADASTASTCFSADTTEASRHLEKVPSGSAEYAEASKLLAVIRQQEERIKEHERQGVSQGDTSSSSPASGTDRERIYCG
jgi:hypothetical protein